MSSAIFLLLCFAISTFPLVNGAPTRGADEVDFSKCGNLSLKLIDHVRKMYLVSSTRISSNVEDPPATIRSIDKCDPQSLQSSKKTCQSRIVEILKNYTRIFHKDGVFSNKACRSWREDAKQVAGVIAQLLWVLEEEPMEDPLHPEPSNYVALCWDSVERLYSFSIINARVFSFLASPESSEIKGKQC